jgi:hypothetical protein
MHGEDLYNLYFLPNVISKVVPLHAMVALGGEDLYLLLVVDLGIRWGEWSASRLGRALPPEKDPLYPLYRRLGGPQSRSGCRD